MEVVAQGGDAVSASFSNAGPGVAPGPWDPAALVRPAVRAVEPYEWEESTEALAARLGLAPEQILRFDMNTSALPPAGLDATLDLVRAQRRVNEYVDARYTALTRAIAAYTGLGEDHILIAAGADEVLAVVVGAFIEPGRRTAMLVPTFPMCAVYTAQYGGTVVGVPYDDAFSGPIDALIEAAQDAHLAFVCSPNNPSGTAFSLADLERIVVGVPCAVVVDEAYFEYHGQTALPLIARYPHLIVVRTFSKAFGMAGARVGYALAAPSMIALLNRLRPPNSVNYIGGLLAQAALRRIDEVRAGVDSVLQEREALSLALQDLGLHVWPSRGNFLLFRFPTTEPAVPPSNTSRGSAPQGAEKSGVEDGASAGDGSAPGFGDPAATAVRVHRRLLDRGLVLRSYRGHPRLAPCLRATVRTRDDNALLLASLREAVAADA
jgi:histidinol-phosphate aminotransferase